MPQLEGMVEIILSKSSALQNKINNKKYLFLKEQSTLMRWVRQEFGLLVQGWDFDEAE